MFDWFFDSVLGWLGTAVAGSIQALWSLLAATLLASPDVTASPQVMTLSARSLVVANTCYVLVILVAGVLVMTRETVQVRYGIAELAPRVVIGLVAANLATPLCRGLIGLGNALTDALTDGPVAGPGAGQQMTTTITAALNDGLGPAKLLVVVITILVVALTAMLLSTSLVRIGVLIVLTGLAPAALACHGLPQLDGVARLWWRSMLATLGTVTLQAFALHAGLSVFLSPGANWPSIGLPGEVTPLANLFVVVCLLWATVKIPKLMSRYVTHATSRAPGGVLVRAVLVQSLMRAARIPLRIR
jgi:hypothetical protein